MVLNDEHKIVTLKSDCTNNVLDLNSIKIRKNNQHYQKRSRFKMMIASVLHSKIFQVIIVSLCALDGLLVICMLLLEIESLKLKVNITILIFYF